MTVKITIVGLGQIGASIGLALANHKDRVTTLGHDKSPEIARRAQKLGAVESISYNLPASIEKAELVLLAIPLDEIRETLKFIGQDLPEQSVVMDTAPVKSAVAGWVKELLPPGRHYVGLTPALNPACLEETAQGINAARADLFHKSIIAITAPLGTAKGALTLAEDLVGLLGAHPVFTDPAEQDGIMASAQLLPGLSAAALAETIIGQPGWPDIQKMAGKLFSLTTQPLVTEEAAALAEALIQDQANVLRVLDEYIASLASMRKEIEEKNNKELTTRLDVVRQGRLQWQLDRGRGEWLAVDPGKAEMPKMGDFLKQHLGGLDKLFVRRKDERDKN